MRCMNIVACTVQYHQLGSISCWQADIGVLPRDIRRTKLAWLFWTYLMRMGCRDNCKQVLKVIRQEAASLPHAYLRNGTHLRTQYTPRLSILFIGQRAVTCPPHPKCLWGSGPLILWANTNLPDKWYPDRFSHFCTTGLCARHRHTRTTVRQIVAVGRIYAMWPNNCAHVG